MLLHIILLPAPRSQYWPHCCVLLAPQCQPPAPRPPRPPLPLLRHAITTTPPRPLHWHWPSALHRTMEANNVSGRLPLEAPSPGDVATTNKHLPPVEVAVAAATEEKTESRARRSAKRPKMPPLHKCKPKHFSDNYQRKLKEAKKNTVAPKRGRFPPSLL